MLPIAALIPPPISDSTRPNTRSVPTTAAALSVVKLSSDNAPSAPAPAEEKPTSKPIGNEMNPSQPTRFARCAGVGRNRLNSATITMVAPMTPVIVLPSMPFRSNTPSSTPGTPPANIKARVRQSTWPRAMYTGEVMIFTTAPKISAVPTAIRGGTPTTRMRRGVVSVPAPTPVMPMAIEIRKPNRYVTTAPRPTCLIQRARECRRARRQEQRRIRLAGSGEWLYGFSPGMGFAVPLVEGAGVRHVQLVDDIDDAGRTFFDADVGARATHLSAHPTGMH